MQPSPQVGAGQQASPGISGAILDAIRAMAQAFAPKAITERKAAVNHTADDAS
jgi:hypothetical protein